MDWYSPLVYPEMGYYSVALALYTIEAGIVRQDFGLLAPPFIAGRDLLVKVRVLKGVKSENTVPDRENHLQPGDRGRSL